MVLAGSKHEVVLEKTPKFLRIKVSSKTSFNKILALKLNLL